MSADDYSASARSGGVGVRPIERHPMTRQKPAQVVPPAAPSHLSPKSQELWDAVVMRQDHCGQPVLPSPGRMALLAVALESLDRADQARVQLDAEGLLLAPTKGGLAHVHPLLKAERDAREQFARIWRGLRLQS